MFAFRDMPFGMGTGWAWYTATGGVRAGHGVQIADAYSCWGLVRSSLYPMILWS